MGYDIYLAGPWEKHTEEYAPFYKTKIKNAFPDKKFFDPETRPAQKREGEIWFKDDIYGLQNTKYFVGLVPPFSFSGSCIELGIFYQMHCKEQGQPLEQIVVIWPVMVKPRHDSFLKQVTKNIVDTPEKAIEKLKDILK